MSKYFHKCADLTKYKNIWIVGDIHGEFSLLEKELSDKNFNEDTDALVMVGDLIDRGPDSIAALKWIKKDFVYRVLGNHDIMPTSYLEGTVSRADVEKWGGAWYINLSRTQIAGIAELLENAPVALTLLTPHGRRIGVTHADCILDWHTLTQSIEKKDDDLDEIIKSCLWSRKIIDSLLKRQRHGIPFDKDLIRVENIDHVFHGHSVLGAPFTCANRTWIDTGACFGHGLTILNIDEFLSNRETPRIL